MIEYVAAHQEDNTPFLLLTECGIASRLQVEYPQVNMVGSCTLCRYMKSNSLEMILSALKNPQPEQIIEIDEVCRLAALRCLETMFYYASL